MLDATRKGRLPLFVIMSLVALLLLQAGTDALAPTGRSDITGRAVGRAGFAYLTGIRTYAAAVLWNRLDPIGHEYYGDKTLDDSTYLLPTVRMVQTLDPQFTQAYYVSAWILFARGDTKTGLDIAREGVRNNPDSGLMIAQLAQLLLFMRDKGPSYLPEATKWADKGIGGDVVWTDAAEKFEGYATFRVIFERSGQPAKAEWVSAQMQGLKGQGGERTQDHDHDGDGKPDH